MLRQEECLEEDARPAAGAEGQKSGQLEQDWGDGGQGGFCELFYLPCRHDASRKWIERGLGAGLPLVAGRRRPGPW